jgi:hypothetical protein
MADVGEDGAGDGAGERGGAGLAERAGELAQSLNTGAKMSR